MYTLQMESDHMLRNALLHGLRSNFEIGGGGTLVTRYRGGGAQGAFS